MREARLSHVALRRVKTKSGAQTFEDWMFSNCLEHVSVIHLYSSDLFVQFGFLRDIMQCW